MSARSRFTVVAVVCAVVVLAGSAISRAAFAESADSQSVQVLDPLSKAVRHELVMLPFFGIFDNLEYEIQGGGTVVLTGQVTRPSLKSDAGNVVKRVNGVSNVVNNIEVLPLSRFDNQIRLATYCAIFSRPGLDRYSWGGLPSVRIIVRNGNIVLEGVVSRQSDKDIAGIVANGIPGVFSVKNNLRVEKTT
jgi:hyperosmotically inducible periplasmic protein